MSIFLDSSVISEIEKYHKMGIIRGITTNPTIMFKDRACDGITGIKEHFIKIAKLVAPYPVSVEVMTNEREKMINQAREFSQWAENINVKITIHGPNGETENLEVVHELETKYDVRVNVTAMMNAQQGLLASLAGATFVSIFGGRINNMGYNCCEEIRKLRKLIDSFNLKSKIIIGSTREVLNIIEWLEAGAHIVTVLPQFLEGMIIHPYSKETVQMFLRDARNIESMSKQDKDFRK